MVTFKLHKGPDEKVKAFFYRPEGSPITVRFGPRAFNGDPPAEIEMNISNLADLTHVVDEDKAAKRAAKEAAKVERIEKRKAERAAAKEARKAAKEAAKAAAAEAAKNVPPPDSATATM